MLDSSIVSAEQIDDALDEPRLVLFQVQESAGLLVVGYGIAHFDIRFCCGAGTR